MDIKLTDSMAKISSFLKEVKDQKKSLHYRLCVNSEAAAVFIRLPVCDSEWTWTVFESTRIICEQYKYALPFFNVEDFPYFNVPEIEGYPAKYLGIDFSHYQYPEQYPPMMNYFALLREQRNPDCAPVHVKG